MPQTESKSSEVLDKTLLKMPINDCLEGFSNLEALVKQTGVGLVLDAELPFLRETVAAKLMDAARHLQQQGYTLKVHSAYRSLDLQRQKFISRYENFKKLHPHRNKRELLTLAATYTAGIPVLAAHTAGAAVDVTLLDAKNQPLDFGVPYRYGGEEANTSYANLPANVVVNRNVLNDALAKHGFTNYPFEYWHYSIGDTFAAYLRGDKSAIYGPVNMNPLTLRAEPLANKRQIYEYFEVEV